MKYWYKLFVSVSGLLLFVGCEDYLDINEDPNNPTEAPLNGLMATTSFRTGNNVQQMGGITSFYVQYLASPNEASATDVQEDVSYDDAWFNLYDIMTDLSDLERQAEEEGSTDYRGIAQLLKAINLGLTVDAWGDVPYDEAFFAETLNPAYDDDEQLYATIQQLLDDGVANLQSESADIPVGEDDFIFGGDRDAWVRAAYALKARYLLHLSETDRYDPSAVLAAIDQGLTGNDDDAQIDYFEEQINPWSQVAENNSNLLLGGWISEQLVEAMDGTTYGYDDPRKPFMFGTTDDTTFVGTPNGAGRGDAPAAGARSTLVQDSYYAAETAPIFIITYAEQKFIEAEAALAAGDPERAYQAYLAGIQAHMTKIGVGEEQGGEEEIAAYLANPEVSVGAANLNRDLILKEKYIALFLHPETWVDARRYDYQYEDMTLPANLNPRLDGQFIRRLVYPESETQRNVETPPAQLGDRLWWDQ